MDFVRRRCASVEDAAAGSFQEEIRLCGGKRGASLLMGEEMGFGGERAPTRIIVGLVILNIV